MPAPKPIPAAMDIGITLRILCANSGEGADIKNVSNSINKQTMPSENKIE